MSDNIVVTPGRVALSAKEGGSYMTTLSLYTSNESTCNAYVYLNKINIL